MIGGEGREGEIESRARELRVARKLDAMGPIAPKVSKENGTSWSVEEVGKEE